MKVEVNFRIIKPHSELPSLEFTQLWDKKILNQFINDLNGVIVVAQYDPNKYIIEMDYANFIQTQKDYQLPM